MKHTFSVTLKNGTKVEDITLNMPDTCDDEAWFERCKNGPADAHTLAVQQWTVKCQHALRDCETAEEAKAKAEVYMYGDRTRSTPTVTADALKKAGAQEFTPEQIAVLKAQGIKIDL